MAIWEIDIEVKVRKTLMFSGPTTAEVAQQMVDGFLVDQNFPISVLQKYTYERGKPEPVEILIDHHTVVDVREVKPV